MGGNNATNNQGMNEMYEYYEERHDQLTSKRRMGYVAFAFAICVNGEAKTLKKLRTSKGVYCIKQ